MFELLGFIYSLLAVICPFVMLFLWNRIRKLEDRINSLEATVGQKVLFRLGRLEEQARR